MEYDASGNILSKTEYEYTTEEDVATAECGCSAYVYDKNKLMSYNGVDIAYSGNKPTSYKGHDLAWDRVKQLTAYGSNTFAYNAEGARVSKNDIIYVVDGSAVVQEKRGNTLIDYFYDDCGIAGFRLLDGDEQLYLFEKDLLGNVRAIYRKDSTALTLVAQYVYDAWGNHTITLDTDGIGTLNPFRYRGYYYDVETGLYYVGGRYYDPETSRFISGDIEAVNPNVFGGTNIYAYAFVGNNSIEQRYDILQLSVNNDSHITREKVFKLKVLSEEVWFDFSNPQFLVFSTSKIAIIDFGGSVYKYTEFSDEAETNSLYISLGNVSAFLGYSVEEEKIGAYADINLLSAGYDGKYIDVGISLVGVGLICGFENWKFRCKVDPPGFFGFDISIDLFQILKDIIVLF